MVRLTRHPSPSRPPPHFRFGCALLSGIPWRDTGRRAAVRGCPSASSSMGAFHRSARAKCASAVPAALCWLVNERYTIKSHPAPVCEGAAAEPWLVTHTEWAHFFNTRLPLASKESLQGFFSSHILMLGAPAFPLERWYTVYVIFKRAPSRQFETKWQIPEFRYLIWVEKCVWFILFSIFFPPKPFVCSVCRPERRRALLPYL